MGHVGARVGALVGLIVESVGADVGETDVGGGEYSHVCLTGSVHAKCSLQHEKPASTEPQHDEPAPAQYPVRFPPQHAACGGMQ